MGEFLNQVLAGVANGGIYASLALALVMIFQATQHINFAQGEMATLSTFGAWFLIAAGMPYWVVFAITVVGSFIMGALVERLVIKPVGTASPFAFIAVTVGLLMIANSASHWIGGGDIREFPSPFPSWFGSRFLSAHETGTIVVTLVVLVALLAFLKRTPFGLAMRAAAQNPVSSGFVGIRVSLMLTIGWGISAAIGAVAGMMVAPVAFLEPNMMGSILLYAFAGALLGGINNPTGAVVGSFAVGIFENLLGVYVTGSELKLTSALCLIVVLLILRPSGLFGKAAVSRV